MDPINNCMDRLIIKFESEDLPKFDILINEVAVAHQIIDDQIVITQDVLFGLNLLNIKLLEGTKVVITDLILNDVSARHTLYLAYYENPNTNSTWLTTQHPDLVIPFGNPISWWIGLCGKKIANSYYGKNLYEFYDIYYPKSIAVNDQLPRLMQDFMRYNFEFLVVEKDAELLHNKSLPWIKINLDYDEASLFDEFDRNKDLLVSNYYKPKQNTYNQKEKGKDLWQVAMAIHHKSTAEYSTEDFPEFFKLIDHIRSQGVDIIHAFIGTVDANSYVAPHADDFYKNNPDYEGTVGCSQFFIPIGWKADNYFKFDGVGFIPYEQGAYIVNNSDFMHGSVNQSDSLRYTIGIYCKFTQNNLQSFKTLS